LQSHRKPVFRYINIGEWHLQMYLISQSSQKDSERENEDEEEESEEEQEESDIKSR